MKKPLSLILCATYFVATASIAGINYVPSGSMLPTMQLGSILAVDKLAYGLRVPLTTIHLTTGAPPQRGEMATFTPPGSHLGTYVKRIVAVAGDTVSTSEGSLIVNGSLVSRVPGLSLMERTWVLQPGEVFMAGDNAANSWDSRFWGPLPTERLTGRVVGVLNTLQRQQPADTLPPL